MDFQLPLYIHEFPDEVKLYEMFGQMGRNKWLKRAAERVYLRTVVAERQNHKCCYCGRNTDHRSKRLYPSLEHILPKSEGGTDDLDNLALACQKCNNNRQSKPLPIEVMQYHYLYGESNV